MHRTLAGVRQIWTRHHDGVDSIATLEPPGYCAWSEPEARYDASPPFTEPAKVGMDPADGAAVIWSRFVVAYECFKRGGAVAEHIFGPPRSVV